MLTDVRISDKMLCIAPDIRIWSARTKLHADDFGDLKDDLPPSDIVRDIAMSAYAVAHAAAGIRGVSVGMTVFPVGYPGEGSCSCPGVSTLMRHGQVAPRLLAFNASGSTPLAEATWATLGKLMKQREPRKILTLFTDGCPDSVAKAEAALRDAEHVGVEVYGISFRNTSIVSLLGEQRSAVIQDIEELPHAFSIMLLSALKRAA